MLNETEFGIFLSEIARELKKLGREAMMAILFNQFSAVNAHKLLDQNTLVSLIAIIEGIIEKRKKQPSTDSSPPQMHLLPSVLIGNIASFCIQKDHIDLSKCCRAMYIGSNTPNTLQQLNLLFIDEEHYSMIDTSKYSQIQRLQIAVERFKYLTFPSDRTVFPKLTHLMIATYDDDFEWVDINPLLNCTAIRFTKVTHLRLSLGGNPDETGLPKEKFVELLSKFPALTHLDLGGVLIQGEFNADDDHLWEGLLPDLQVFEDHHYLSSNDIDCVESIIRSRANQLKSVRLHNENEYILPKDLRFGSLEELNCGSRLSRDTMAILRPSLKSLRRLCINFADVGLRPLDQAQEALEVVSDVLSSTNQLEECVIWTSYTKLESICTALELSSQTCYHQADTVKNSMQLKLCVRMERNTVIGMPDIMDKISRMVDALHSSNIGDYFFSWHFKELLPEEKEWNTEIGKFTAENRNRFDVSFSRENLLISKKDSHIAGCIQNYMLDGWLVHQ